MKRKKVKYIAIASLVIGVLILICGVCLLFGIVPPTKKIASAEIIEEERRESIKINADDAKTLITDLKKKRIIAPNDLTYYNLKIVFYDKSGHEILTLRSLYGWRENGHNVTDFRQVKLMGGLPYTVDKSFYDDLRMIADRYNLDLNYD